ncbi:MAG: DUF1257 domain-containing protein [Anaerolineaceae bacterium]
MSHISRIKTQMVDKTLLLAALKDLGYAFKDQPSVLHGFGARTPVDIVVSAGPLKGEIGLRKSGEVYEIIADWWGVHGITQKQFTDKLAQRYAYLATRNKLEEQGFSLVSEQTEKDGRIHILLRRMG